MKFLKGIPETEMVPQAVIDEPGSSFLYAPERVKAVNVLTDLLVGQGHFIYPDGPVEKTMQFESARTSHCLTEGPIGALDLINELVVTSDISQVLADQVLPELRTDHFFAHDASHSTARTYNVFRS